MSLILSLGLIAYSIIILIGAVLIEATVNGVYVKIENGFNQHNTLKSTYPKRFLYDNQQLLSEEYIPRIVKK